MVWRTIRRVIMATALGGICAPVQAQWTPWFTNRNTEPTGATSLVPTTTTARAFGARTRRPLFRQPAETFAPATVPVTTYYAPAGISAAAPAAVPVTTYYAPAGISAAPASHAPVAAAAPALTTYYAQAAAPAMPAAVAPAYTQQVIVSYRPETRYRTRWMRVPVTNYRPVVTTDPTTGAQTAFYQPCTTYRWQLSRVPYIRYHASYAAAAPCAPVQLPAATQAPYYNAAPSSTVIQGQSAAPAGPSGNIRLAPPPGTGGGEPADRPPSLKPEVGGSSTTIRSESATPPPPANDPASTELNGPGGQPATGASQLRLRPVPDPDSPARRRTDPEASRKLEAPQLLNPRDRTADRHDEHAWTVVPIVWATAPSVPATPSRTASYIQPLEADPDVEQQTRPVYDDRGWTSLRPPR